jgi:hypothetical protein
MKRSKFQTVRKKEKNSIPGSQSWTTIPRHCWDERFGFKCGIDLIQVLGDTGEGEPDLAWRRRLPVSYDSAQRFDHYELVLEEEGRPVELGRGAMGVTYKAFDINLCCPVTLKVIAEKYLGDEAARLRFLREARAAASVRHPNVASVFHLGKRGQDYFYAMEFVEGETLQNLIKRSGHLDIRVALEIVEQVAAGLSAIHKQQLVHRDIKLRNVIVRIEEGGAVSAKIQQDAIAA